MLRQDPDRAARGEQTAKSRRSKGSAAVAGAIATVAVLVLGATLSGQRVGPRVTGQDTLRVAGNAPPGDLRCLTRRDEDCLDEPVPASEPHGAVCATCHTLWERSSPGGSIRSCTAAGCHENPVTLTPFHETIDAATLEDCMACHPAHSFRVPDATAGCLVCHPSGGRPAVQAKTSPARRLPRELPFTHGGHSEISCLSCHSSRDAHGRITVANVENCQSCHHDSAKRDDCVMCHQPDETAGVTFTVLRTLDIRIGSLQQPLRTLRFEHARHDGAVCTACHTGDDFTVPASSDCSSCHLEHHDPTADCSGCHIRPADGAHDRYSHLGCGGSSCHERVPAAIEFAPRTRSLCLACHTELSDHMPGRDCAGCHALPAPRERKDR